MQRRTAIMKPGPYYHLAALVRQKREEAVTRNREPGTGTAMKGTTAMSDTSYHSHQSQRLTAYLKEAHAKTLQTVQIHGWWEMDTIDEMRDTTLEELYELIDALRRFDFHGPHGVFAEGFDAIAVISKLMLRAQDMAERGEL